MFLAAKIKYAQTKNKFNSFNTDQKSIRKSKNVAFSLKKLNSLRISLVLLGTPYGKTRGPLGETEGLRSSSRFRVQFSMEEAIQRASRVGGHDTQVEANSSLKSRKAFVISDLGLGLVTPSFS